MEILTALTYFLPHLYFIITISLFQKVFQVIYFSPYLRKMRAYLGLLAVV